MKITHVQSTFVAPLGGAESYVLALAAAQARHGDCVEIVTAWTDPETVARARRSGVVVRQLPVRRPYRPDEHGSTVTARVAFHALDLWGAFVVPRALRRVQKPDRVVHVHRFQGIGSAILRAQAAPVVHTAHDYCLVDTTSTSVRHGIEQSRLGLVQRLRARVLWRSARRADVVVFPSVRTRRRHAALGLPLDEIDARVVPHGWIAAAHPEDRQPSARPRFVFLGKLQKEKGIETLLRAWEQAGIDGELVIAGDGPLRGVVEKAVGETVTYVGWADDARKAALLSTATALVFPSQWPETFGLVIAESLLAGCPVIATPDAAGSLVIDGVNGVVSASSSAEALAAALERVALDARLRATLTDGARASAADLDFDTHLARITRVYTDAITHFDRSRRGL